MDHSGKKHQVCVSSGLVNPEQRSQNTYIRVLHASGRHTTFSTLFCINTAATGTCRVAPVTCIQYRTLC